MPVEKGISSVVFAALSPLVRTDPGKYGGSFILSSGKLRPTSEESQDLGRAKEMMEFTFKPLKEKGINLE